MSSHRLRVRSVQNTGISAASRTCISDMLLSNVVQHVGARQGTTCPVRCPPGGAPSARAACRTPQRRPLGKASGMMPRSVCHSQSQRHNRHLSVRQDWHCAT